LPLSPLWANPLPTITDKSRGQDAEIFGALFGTAYVRAERDLSAMRFPAIQQERSSISPQPTTKPDATVVAFQMRPQPGYGIYAVPRVPCCPHR